jgi:recombinational DNA repair protein RecR
MPAAHANGLNGFHGDEKQITELKKRISKKKRTEIIK